MIGKTEIVALKDYLETNDESELKIARSFLEDTILELEEIQRYRAIGTVEEIKRMKKYSALAKKHGTIGKVIEACAEYEEIGTVEECREAAEKQREKKYKLIHPCKSVNYYQCPVCDSLLHINENYCGECGQAISWERDTE